MLWLGRRLQGKFVEVKSAEPKEAMPGPGDAPRHATGGYGAQRGFSPSYRDQQRPTHRYTSEDSRHVYSLRVGVDRVSQALESVRWRVFWEARV